MATTFVTARRELGQLIGKYGVFTATSGSTTSAVCAAAFASSILPTDAAAFVWFYVPAGTSPLISRVTGLGLDSATGTLTLDGALGAAVGNGTVFEMSPKLPPVTSGEAMGPSLTDCLNRALRHILVPRTVTRLLSPGTNDFPITATWLDRASRLVDVRVQTESGTTKLPAWRTWELREDVNEPVLHFDDPFRYGSGTYYLELVTRCPAFNFINDAESSAGFSAEDDEADVELKDLMNVALVFAYDALRKQRSGAAAGTYQRLYEEQVAIARRTRGYDHGNDIDPSVPTAPAPVEVA